VKLEIRNPNRVLRISDFGFRISDFGMAKGPLIILSGPSGVGKSELVKRLLAGGELPLRLSVSATTRRPRAGERDGVNYHYWPRERFEEEVRAGGFLEWAEVFGNLYGTLKREVEPYRERGEGVLLEIDVQGAEQVRLCCPDAVSIFLKAPSLETYEQRLRRRHTEGEEAIRRRLEGARRELAQAGTYKYQIVNDDLDRAVGEVKAVIRRQFGGQG
jgi:guanylate kinase